MRRILPVSQIRLIFIWLLVRGPKAILMRLVLQSFRLITGRPIFRYCQLTSQLYVGGQPYQRGWSPMQLEGINTIINLRRSDDLARGLSPRHYLHLPTPDNHPPSIEDLHCGVAFIAKHLAEGDVVYVHCGVGVGRAPTLVVTYLVSTGMLPEEAWEKVRKIRPIILPLPSQKRQVMAYYEQLTGGNKSEHM